MDLEERTLEQAGDRCEECGATLTQPELQLVLEKGGPTLCSIHATDVVAAGEAEEPGGDEPLA